MNESGDKSPNRSVSSPDRKHLYENIVENLLHEVHVWEIIRDDDGAIKTWRLLDANPAALQSWGKPLEEIIGKTTDEIFPHANATELFLPVVNRIFNEKKPCEWELAFPPTNQFLRMTSIPFDGFFISMGMDISEQKRNEEALAQSLEMHKRTEAIAKVGSWEWNISEDRVYWSDELFRIFKWDPAQGAPSYAQHVELSRRDALFSAEDMNRLNTAVEECQTHKKPYEIKVKAICQDGEIKTCISRGQAIEDKNGTVVKLVGSFEDVTEKEEMQKRLRQSQKLEAIGTLAGGIAHDFNNMLSVILGYTEISLGIVDPNGKLYRNLSEIQKAAQRSAKLTSQLLAFARKQRSAPAAINLNEVIEDILTMLQRLIGENIRLEWFPADDLWTVFLDISHVDQIMANICVNARDAIQGQGCITVRTRNETLRAGTMFGEETFIPGDYVLIIIQDDGCGMDEGVMQNIFDPFFTTKGVGEGTGLGLSTVFGLVKQNRGYVQVESEVDRGTSFTLYFPRYGHAVPAEVAVQAARNQPASGSILLIEDEPLVIDIATQMLQELGYQVHAYTRANEAIEFARNAHSIDLLVTDVIMPEMNGNDIADAIRSTHPDVPVLFMSGYPADVILKDSTLPDGVHFLQKPFDQKSMSERVREVLKP